MPPGRTDWQVLPRLGHPHEGQASRLAASIAAWKGGDSWWVSWYVFCSSSSESGLTFTEIEVNPP